MTRKVLFLDDDRDLREVIVELLQSFGVGCRSVATMEELRSAVESGDYDLAILDINLGVSTQSGIDAYRWLRDVGFRGRIAFLTGHARTDPMVREALRFEDVKVYDKPISAAGLRALVG
jgi:DNA-binding response OmpR family regulator